MCPAQISGLPFILACSACSKCAQIANDLARVMDAEGFAKQIRSVNLINSEPGWLKQIKEGRPVMVIDGCSECCMQRLLASYCVAENWHINLHDFGFEHSLDGMRSIGQLSSVVRVVQNLLSTAPG